MDSLNDDFKTYSERLESATGIPEQPRSTNPQEIENRRSVTENLGLQNTLTSNTQFEFSSILERSQIGSGENMAKVTEEIGQLSREGKTLEPAEQVRQTSNALVKDGFDKIIKGQEGGVFELVGGAILEKFILQSLVASPETHMHYKTGKIFDPSYVQKLPETKDKSQE